MFDSSTCFGPTGPSSRASINCVLLVWYVKIVCCSVRPYIRNFHNHLTYGRTEQQTIFTYQTSSSWGWTCRSETCRAVKHIVNKYSTITKVVYLVGLRMYYCKMIHGSYNIKYFLCVSQLSDWANGQTSALSTSLLGTDGDLRFFYRVQSGSAFHRNYCTGGFPPGLSGRGMRIGSSGTEFKNIWKCTSTSTSVFKLWYWVKHTGNSTFPLQAWNLCINYL